MYSAQPNGAEGATINPAALNSADLNRGIKRSRSPESYQDPLNPGVVDDDKPRKRGRPMKASRTSGGLSESSSQGPMPPTPQSVPPKTPQSQNMPLPAQNPQQQYMPPQQALAPPQQASPPAPKPTPTKSTLKALPTVRDHTTDQLGPGGDEYLPREIDEAGEKKVMPNGQLLGPREYRCRTFQVPNRGEKLFMLATECARILGYRDSYLLFNKNRSLFKIIANQVEKDDLVQQEILPFSYRSRQIAIVTARSMFRQFGSRVIVNGRRVRDDYWETKARKQGFTEADLAGEKRPGATRAREAANAANAEANQQNAAMLGGPHGEIVYSNNPGQFGGAPQPPLMQPEYTDTRSRDYSSILKAPRQEITGPAYQDRTQPTAVPELHAQAHHAAEFNRGVNQQREMRGEYMQSMWRRPHEQPPPTSGLGQPIGAPDSTIPTIPTSRSAQPPHSSAGAAHQPQPQHQQHQQHQHHQQQQQQQHQHQQAAAPSQAGQGVVSSQSPQMLMTAAPYSTPLTSQTQMQPARLGSSGGLQQGAQAYNYPSSTQMWPQTPQTPQYSYSHQPQAQASPHQQQSSASQIRGQPGAGAQSVPYSGMPGISQGYTAAPGPTHGLPYDQTPRQYMHQSAASSPPVTQGGWSGQPQSASGWWGNQPQ